VFSYQLPFGRGRRWGADWESVANGILGGWRLSGTVRAYTGNPFTVTIRSPDLDAGESARPNRLGDGYVSADSQPGRKGIDFPWYDLDAFEPVPSVEDEPSGVSPFSFGNSGRNILNGPGLFTVNAAFSKDISIKEDRLQLRLEVFNLFNRPNFILTSTVRELNNPTAGYLNQVGAVGPGGGPRIFQLAVKYMF
jgi:hypothetical protein